MKKDKWCKKLSFSFFILCFTLLIPLPWNCNTVKAESISNSSYTEDKQPEVKLNVKKKSLVKGTSYTLVLYNLSDSYKVSFKSNDSDIASVDKDGVVSATNYGDATITITIRDGSKTIQTLTCDITVGVPAVSIMFKDNNKDKSGITLTVGKSSLLETIISPNNTVEEAKFSSSDSSVATVSSNGRVTAKSTGTAYIFGTLANGKFARILITVVSDDTTVQP